jgi:hypothetical protein
MARSWYMGKTAAHGYVSISDPQSYVFLLVLLRNSSFCSVDGFPSRSIGFLLFQIDGHHKCFSFSFLPIPISFLHGLERLGRNFSWIGEGGIGRGRGLEKHRQRRPIWHRGVLLGDYARV